MTERRDREAEGVRAIHEFATRAFAHHEIRDLTDHKVACARPGSGSHAFEVVLLGWGSMVVHGDIEAVVFQGGDGGGLVDRVAWLASGDIEYVHGKARRSAGHDYRVFDDEAFADAVEARVERIFEERAPDEDEDDDAPARGHEELRMFPRVRALVAAGGVKLPSDHFAAAAAMEAELIDLSASEEDAWAWGRFIGTETGKELLWPGRAAGDADGSDAPLPADFLRHQHALWSKAPAKAAWGRLGHGFCRWSAEFAARRQRHTPAAGRATRLSKAEAHTVRQALHLAWRLRNDDVSEHEARREAHDLGLELEYPTGFVYAPEILWAHEAARTAFRLLRPHDALARFSENPTVEGLSLYNRLVGYERAAHVGRLRQAIGQVHDDVERIMATTARPSPGL